MRKMDYPYYVDKKVTPFTERDVLYGKTSRRTRMDRWQIETNKKVGEKL